MQMTTVAISLAPATTLRTPRRVVPTETKNPSDTNGWPADLVSGGIPDSTNRVNIVDLNSFLSPRRLDTNPGDPNFNQRWDLVPGRGIFATWINIADLNSLLAVGPAMLGGQAAFNGPDCPWPP